MSAQTLNRRYLAYIERYRAVALEQEESHGVPASITLAQGLLESNAGQSYLAQRGNNHFGIKCHSTWHGPSVEFDDTLRHACYRKYGSPEDSFLDHARFLCTRRYAPLHELDPTDYRGWAQGLRDCGYAEDPDYPRKLVALIEQYKLNELSGVLANVSVAEVSDVTVDDFADPNPQPKTSASAAASGKKSPAGKQAKADRKSSRRETPLVAPDPSPAQVDADVARRRPPRERLRRAGNSVTNASTDN